MHRVKRVPLKNLIVPLAMLAVVLFAIVMLAESIAKSAEAKSSEIGFASLSPAGEKGGAIVPASCEAGVWNNAYGSNHPDGNNSGVCGPACTVSGGTYPGVEVDQTVPMSCSDFRTTYFDNNGDYFFYAAYTEGTPTWTVNNCTGDITYTGNCHRPPVDGKCGPANGVLSPDARPSSGLCDYGDVSTQGGGDGQSPWTWLCAGQNGGTTDYCSAPKTTNTPSVQLNFI